MSASQAHGSKIEAAILESSLFKPLPTGLRPTSAVDAPAGHSNWALNPGHPSQIKSAKARASTFDAQGATHVDADIGLADAERCMATGGLEMIACVWSQATPATKSALAYHRMLFAPGSWTKLFGTLPQAKLETLCRDVKAKPEDGIAREDFDAITAGLHARARQLEEGHGMVAKLRIKIDTKGQRRVQVSCPLSSLQAASDASDFLSPAAYAAAKLPASFASAPRQRRPKERAEEAAPAEGAAQA